MRIAAIRSSKAGVRRGRSPIVCGSDSIAMAGMLRCEVSIAADLQPTGSVRVCKASRQGPALSCKVLLGCMLAEILGLTDLHYRGRHYSRTLLQL